MILPLLCRHSASPPEPPRGGAEADDELADEGEEEPEEDDGEVDNEGAWKRRSQ